MKKLLLVLMFVPLVSFGQDFKVVRVIDGDTFIIEGGERVRMIGIDAPELKDLYGVESKNQLKALIQNKHVKLIKGVVTANKDYFKRLLRYVYIDSTDINLKMIEDGFASVYLKYPFSKSSEYKTIFDYIKTNKLR
jgi:micrococcal nuclease